jgi:hypothetical protein
MTTRFQVPATLQRQLEAKATAEGLTIEQALVRAIECWVLEDEVFELVVNQVLDRAKARVAAVLDKHKEPAKPEPDKNLDALLARGFRQAPAQPGASWEPPGGWDADATAGWE